MQRSFEFARPRKPASDRRRAVATLVRAQLDSYKLLKQNGASEGMLRAKASNILLTWRILEGIK